MTIQLYKGDCLEVMKQIPDKSVDMVMTSPPYDNLRTYNDTCNWSFDVFKPIANELYRVIKDGGVVVWNVKDATINGSETGTSFRQALYFKEIGFNIHDTMIWLKDTFTFPQSTTYRDVFEYMFIFSKRKPKTINLIQDRRNKTAGQKVHGTERMKNGTTKRKSCFGNITGDYGVRFNVWDISGEKNNRTGHPAVFPIKLAQDHIISWSNENDVVLDPFMGSGTTGVACKRLNRNFIGIELDDKYFEIAKNRIEGELV